MILSNFFTVSVVETVQLHCKSFSSAIVIIIIIIIIIIIKKCFNFQPFNYCKKYLEETLGYRAVSPFPGFKCSWYTDLLGKRANLSLHSFKFK